MRASISEELSKARPDSNQSHANVSTTDLSARRNPSPLRGARSTVYTEGKRKREREREKKKQLSYACMLLDVSTASRTCHILTGSARENS